MATNSTTVDALYTDIVSELAIYFADATLIDNPQFMTNKFDISGSSGNTVRVPITKTRQLFQQKAVQLSARLTASSIQVK